MARRSVYLAMKCEPSDCCAPKRTLPAPSSATPFGAVEKATDLVRKGTDKAKELVQTGAEKAKELVHEGSDKAKETARRIGQKVEDTGQKIKDGATDKLPR